MPHLTPYPKGTLYAGWYSGGLAKILYLPGWSAKADGAAL